MSQPYILYRVPTGKRKRFQDSAEVTAVASLTASEIHITTVSGSATSVAIVITASDIYTPVIEGGLVVSFVILTPDSGGDERNYAPDAAAVTSTTNLTLSVTSVDYVAEVATLTSVAVISSADTHGSVSGTNYIDAGTITSVAGISATQIYTTLADAATITAVASVTATEVTSYVSESGTVTGTSGFVTVAGGDFIDPAPNLTTIVTAVSSIVTVVENVAWNPDANTITSIAVPLTISGDVEASIDASTYLVPSVNLLPNPGLILLAPVASTAVPSALDNQAFAADAGTVTSIAVIVTTSEVGPVRVNPPIATASTSASAPLIPSQPVLPSTAIATASALIPGIQLVIAPAQATATASVPAVSPNISLFPPLSTAVTAGFDWSPTTGALLLSNVNLTGSDSDWATRETALGRRYHGAMKYKAYNTTSLSDFAGFRDTNSHSYGSIAYPTSGGFTRATNAVYATNAGTFDSNYITFANTVKGLAPLRMWIRLFWEANLHGSVYNPVNYTDAAGVALPGTWTDFQNAWIRIWTIFFGTQAQYTALSISGTPVGCSSAQVKFAYAPNKKSGSGTTSPDDPTLGYPGSQYVDWIMIDTYPNRVTSGSSEAMDSFSILVTHPSTTGWTDWYNTFSSYGKPLGIGETCVHPVDDVNFQYTSGDTSPRTRVQWWTAALAALKSTYPLIRMVTFYDANDAGYPAAGTRTYKIDAASATTNDSSSQAFAAYSSLANDAYLNPVSLSGAVTPSSLIPDIQLGVSPDAMTASASSTAPATTSSFALANTFEGGSNGTTITTGNSGSTSGNAFDSTSGTVPIFSTTQAMHGTLALSMQGTGNVRWSSTSVTGGNTTLYGRTYVYITAAPNVTAILVGGQTPTSSTLGQFILRINTTRKVGLIAKSGTAVASTTSLTTATWYRLEFKMVTVASGTCTLDCNIYVGDSTTLTEAMTQATGTGGVNDTSINGFLWGSVNNVTANVVFLDDMQVNSSGFPGHS